MGFCYASRMLFSLPHSGKEVEIRDFIPHKLAKKINAAQFSGIKMGSSIIATKQELVNEFGAKTMDEIEKLEPKEYEKKLQDLREKFSSSRMSSGLTLANLEKGNVIKIIGMVIRIGKITEITEEMLDDIPEKDFNAILKEITKMEEVPLGKGKSRQSKG